MRAQMEPGIERIPIGISSCLLGQRVRFDGGHKGHSYIMGTLTDYFEFRPFCPEMAIGLPVPRKPIRLTRDDSEDIRCVAVDDPTQEFTKRLRDCADQQRGWQEALCGYILKKDSPSCGMERVKVWGEGMPFRNGVGVFAGRMMRNFPYLPVEEEGRLGDAVLRENFVQRVYALRRWHAMAGAGLGVSALSDFHARHKLIIMSHEPLMYQRLGQLVARTDSKNLAQNAESYLLQFMQALKIRATRGKHVNVLQHIQGYLKKHLDGADKRELGEAIERYRVGQLPLIVPITLLNHFFRKHPNDYIARSWYMQPYPAELSLQNTI